MVSSSEVIYKWGVYIRPSLNSMCSKNITLLGDAAHPMVPFLGQGGCMAIEDAYTFGILSGELDCDFNKVQPLYETIRLQRNNRIQSASMLQGKLNHIKNPIAAFTRNLLMSHTPLLAMRTEKIWNYNVDEGISNCLLYTSPSPRDRQKSRMPSSA